MPSKDYFPDKLKELSLKHSPDFSFSFFDAYLDKLIEKKFITAEAHVKNKATSVFKFYSNENCQVFKEGKLVCSLEGMSDEPYYLPVPRKGDYRFKAVNAITADQKIFKEHIDSEEDKEIEIEWEERKPFKPDQEWPQKTIISGDSYSVDLGALKFNMIRVEGGEMMIGATTEQLEEAEGNEYPAHLVKLSTYYIGQFPVTQNIWELVMGYNKSIFKNKEENLANGLPYIGTVPISIVGGIIGGMAGALWGIGRLAKDKVKQKIKDHLLGNDYGHYPIENISHDEALEFVRRLSQMTNIHFSLPTEEEWEYAARGGQKSQGYKYAGSNDLNEVAWYKDNSNGTTSPVGEKRPNELGLYDMCGNVWEWTETPAHSYASDVELDGTIFIRRGGSWWHEAKNCRVSRRYASDHSKKTSGLGLRVVIREIVG